jgi:hypothetical protein
MASMTKIIVDFALDQETTFVILNFDFALDQEITFVAPSFASLVRHIALTTTIVKD